MQFDRKHFQFKHPYNSLIVGMTGSGKTILVRRILKNFKELFYNLNKEEIKILWAYGQWHHLIDIPLNDHVIIRYIEGLPNDEIINEFKPDIIVIDDLMNEMNKDSKFENIFIKKSHHLNISIFFLVQNLFYNSKSMRTISLNCHYIILMKNPRDKSQINHLAKQIFPSNSKYLIEAYNSATEPVYGYIKIDLSPDTPEDLRLQSRTTPEENCGKFSPIIYYPKNV